MEYSDPEHIHAPKVVSVCSSALQCASDDYEYDANGNLVDDGERVISWNQDNLPVKITKDNTEVKFSYDANGQRVAKEVKDLTTGAVTKTVYVNQYYQLLTINNQQSSTKYYFANGRVAVRNTTGGNSELTFLHQDHLGSTVLATDTNSQSLSNSLSYFPYGSSISNQLSAISNYLFTGQELDDEASLYNYNARLYNPKTGAFISADTLGGGNRYAYAANNPMIFTDPTGHAVDAGDGGGGGGPYLPLIMKDYYSGPWIGAVPANDAGEIIPLDVVDYFLSGRSADNWMLWGGSNISEAYQYYRDARYRGEPVYEKMYGSFANYVAHQEMTYRITMLAAGMTAPLKTDPRLRVEMFDNWKDSEPTHVIRMDPEKAKSFYEQNKEIFEDPEIYHQEMRKFMEKRADPFKNFPPEQYQEERMRAGGIFFQKRYFIETLANENISDARDVIGQIYKWARHGSGSMHELLNMLEGMGIIEIRTP